MPPSLCPLCLCISCSERITRKCLPKSLSKLSPTQGHKACPMHSSDMSSSIVLYDVDRRGHRACWSPNAWKIRFVLNFKQIDYETRWLDFPDIAPTLKSL